LLIAIFDGGLPRVLGGPPPTSQDFNNRITDERSSNRNNKIGHSENIHDCPNQALAFPNSRMRELSHQEIGVEKEDYKAYFRDRSQGSLYHDQPILRLKHQELFPASAVCSSILPQGVHL
jgi:hypothetical protein